MNEIPNRTNVIGEFLGKRECFAYKTGATLTQRVIEAFNVGRFTSFLANGFVAFGGQHTGIDSIEVSETHSALSIFRR